MDLDATNPVFGFPTKGDSNQSPQLQTSLKIEILLVASFDDTFQQVNNKCADQTSGLSLFLFANPGTNLKTGFLTSKPT